MIGVNVANVASDLNVNLSYPFRVIERWRFTNQGNRQFGLSLACNQGYDNFQNGSRYSILLGYNPTNPSGITISNTAEVPHEFSSVGVDRYIVLTLKPDTTVDVELLDEHGTSMWMTTVTSPVVDFAGSRHIYGHYTESCVPDIYDVFISNDITTTIDDISGDVGNENIKKINTSAIENDVVVVISGEGSIVTSDVTTTELSHLIRLTGNVQNQLDVVDSKASSADVYTKTEVDNALSLKADQATTYTKTEVDNALSLKADDIEDIDDRSLDVERVVVIETANPFNF